MRQLFAQTDYADLDTSTVDPYSTYNESVELAGLDEAALAGITIIIIVLTALWVAGWWKMFQKAGRPGWAAVVPVYNFWTFFEIAGRPGWWSLAILALYVTVFIPIVGIIPAIAILVMFYIVCRDISVRFGKGLEMTLLQFFLPWFAYPILGFGDAKYNAEVTGSNGPNVGMGVKAANAQSSGDISATPSLHDEPIEGTEDKSPQEPNRLVR